MFFAVVNVGLKGKIEILSIHRLIGLQTNLFCQKFSVFLPKKLQFLAISTFITHYADPQIITVRYVYLFY